MGCVFRDVTIRPTPLMVNVTQMSWKKALGVFEARLADLPFEHSVKLRHWKPIVERVYSEFVTKLPDADPTPLSPERNWRTAPKNRGTRT